MPTKVAKTDDEAWDIQTIPDSPHAFIQWKGTEVCMDIYCDCGKQFHIDSDFTYNVECPYCNTVYFCNGHIELIKVENPSGNVICGEKTEDEQLDDLIDKFNSSN